MSIRINENANIVHILNQARQSVNGLSRATQRLASGVRFESAGDDPGAIGSVIFTDKAITGIQRNQKSLITGISITQKLDSNLVEIESLLHLIKDLAVQAASDVYTDEERVEFQKSAEVFLDEIDKIVNTKENPFLDGTQSQIQVTSETVPKIELESFKTSDLGETFLYDSQRRGIFVSALTTDDLKINDISIRPTTASDDQLSTTYQSGSAIAKALAINTASDVTKVTAEVGPTIITGNRSIGAVDLTGLNYFSINGSVINGFSFDVNDNTQTLREGINAETRYTGVTASVDSAGQLVLRAEDGRNIQVRYANQDVLSAVGVTDKSGDVPNLIGAVELASPDRVLQGEVQTPIDTNFSAYLGNVSVGGRFDASEDYVDFVAQVVTAGTLGSAEIRIDRDPASELVPAEDFAFIDGTVDPVVTQASVTGDFFSLGGTATAGGSYNEALDREYILTVTTGGSSDGTDRAAFDVSTTEDGFIKSFTASGGTPVNIASTTTGEDVILTLSPSIRTTTSSSSIAAGQAYNSTVTLGGSYNQDEDRLTVVEVLTSGRTQGTPQATVRVLEDGVEILGSTPVTGGQAIDISNGQTLSFATDTTEVSGVTTSITGSYGRAITVNSAVNDFTGIGSGTYAIEVTQAGPTGTADYIVKKDGAVINAEGTRTLDAGTIGVTDGITFDVTASVSSVGGAVVSTAHGPDTTDHYQAYGGVTFEGTYDGLQGDTTLEVRVKQEGRVIGAGEVGTTDHALLEYRFGTDAFQGDIIAQEGAIGLSNGLSIRLPAASDPTQLAAQVDDSDLGVSNTFAANTVGGYDGTIQVDLDQSTFAIGEDVQIELDTTNTIQIPGSAPASGTITVNLRSVNTGNIVLTQDIDPISGTVNNITTGLDITFTNSTANDEDVTTLSDFDLIHTNVHSLQSGDLFSTSLVSESFEVGDTVSVDVDSAHLAAGSTYTVDNRVGTFDVGDIIKVNATHAFSDTRYTLQASTPIVNELTLDFDQDGQFNIGDEIRFQVRGYTGNPTASGDYTYAISPTTFSVEVTTTGDVDGAARFKYTRADTGESVDGLSASTTPVELDDGVEIAFSAGRLYSGDQFFVETFESLSQTFGGTLTLSSNKEIKIDYDSLDGDNLLGRLAYDNAQGDADDPGVTNNPTSKLLRKNEESSVGEINLQTEDSSQKAIKLAVNAINSLSAYRVKLTNVRTQIGQVLKQYQEEKDIKEEYLSQLQKVDIDEEATTLVNSIIQQKGQTLLNDLSQKTSNTLLTLMQESLIAPEMIDPPKIDYEQLRANKDLFSQKKKEDGLFGQKKKPSLLDKLQKNEGVQKTTQNSPAFQQWVKDMDESMTSNNLDQLRRLGDADSTD